MPIPVRLSRVRYIKRGREGGWEQECLKKGIIRRGFGTAKEERIALQLPESGKN
jgi:hypothetical protein